ncbi:aegerolysin type hemolysin [Pisolithus sp. B1]|nr:aegerolysin type hemolysin [Pisolithus sp. B1]
MDPEAVGFGKALWICMNIKNSLGNKIIKVQNATVTWYGDALGRLNTHEINGITISPGAVAAVSACRRPSSFAGTEGSIDLFDQSTRICTIFWDLPSASKQNRLEIKNSHNNYVVTVGAWESFGTIGHASVEVQRA